MTVTPVTLQELSGVDWLFLFSEVLVTALGLGISYIAYVGYRRHDSRPMLLFCVGFALVVGVPAVVGSVIVFGGVGGGRLAGAISQLSRIVGMALILIALRIGG